MTEGFKLISIRYVLISLHTYRKSAVIIVIFMIFSMSSTTVSQAYRLGGSYTNISAQAINYSSFENTVLLVDATASWCTACDLQLKNLNKVYDSVDVRVSILTLSIDINDELSQVAELKTRHDSKWIFGKDSDLDFKGQYEVINLPTLFLFKEDGSMYKKWEGVTDAKIILDEINKHFEVPFEAAFNTDSSAEVGNLLDDLFSNILFKIVSLILAAIFVYLKIMPSSPKKVIETKS